MLGNGTVARKGDEREGMVDELVMFITYSNAVKGDQEDTGGESSKPLIVLASSGWGCPCR